MQFSVISLLAALATTTSAADFQSDGTSAATYQSGAGAETPHEAGALSKRVIFTGAASMPQALSGSALGLVIAGGVALVSLPQHIDYFDGLTNDL